MCNSYLHKSQLNFYIAGTYESLLRNNHGPEEKIIKEVITRRSGNQVLTAWTDMPHRTDDKAQVKFTSRLDTSLSHTAVPSQTQRGMRPDILWSLVLEMRSAPHQSKVKEVPAYLFKYWNELSINLRNEALWCRGGKKNLHLKQAPLQFQVL